MDQPSHSERPRSTRLIEDMLKQRKRMLTLLWQLWDEVKRGGDAPVKATLSELLMVLVDYIAAGHFSLYERLMEGTERRKPVLSAAHEILPRIAATTDIAVDFSDKYEEPDDEQIGTTLAKDLSRLGEELTTRIELEDQLILAMLGRNYVIPSSAPG